MYNMTCIIYLFVHVYSYVLSSELVNITLGGGGPSLNQGIKVG